MRKHYPDRTELDMNCIPGSGIRLIPLCILVVLTSSVSFSATEPAEPRRDRVYGADYSITPDISKAGAFVELKISQNRGLLRELTMSYEDKPLSDVSGDGQITIDESGIRWVPPVDGGRLRWFAAINHRRNGDTFDAYIGETWALFRAEDVIPPTATRTLKRSVSVSRLTFALPDGWSAVTEYFRRSGVFDVSNPDRRFDKPSGWILLGHIGVRHETIAGVRVVVAAPVGQGTRRLDILAMLNWNLPALVHLFPDFPRRLTVVSAGQPMWRGGLSAPGSFYLHADRPLISENGTSTILHEAVHVGLNMAAAEGSDWVVEGLAEYYGLEILRRSGTISEKRYRAALSDLANWGKKVRSLCASSSSGAITARAVTLFADLNNEIRRQSAKKADLDDALPRLANSQSKISTTRLRQIVLELTGSDSDVLSDKTLNNCEN
jgi:hypothetical protein